MESVGRGLVDVNRPHSGSVLHVFTRPAGGWAATSEAVELTVPGVTDINADGQMVSLDGNAIVVGGPAYLFERPSAGWTSHAQATQLTAPDGRGLVGSVAVDGDIILVGSAPTVHMFIRRGEGGAFTLDRITAPDGDGYGRFGWSLDLDGHTALIGSLYLGGRTGAGSAYLMQLGSAPDLEISTAAVSRLVHPGSETTYTLMVANIGPVASTGATMTYPLHDDQRAVALETTQGRCTGTRVVTCDLGALAAGASAAITATVRIAPDAGGDIVTTAAVITLVDLNPANNSASAAITVVDPSIRPLAKLTPGVYVHGPMDFDEASLVYGVPGEWGGGGTAYVLSMPSGGWESSAAYSTELDPRGGASGIFGSSVAVDGDTLVVGAPQDHESGYHWVQSGSAHVFVRSEAGWRYAAKLTREDGSATDRFGGAVAVDGDTIVVGAPKAVRAYVFVEPSDGWKSTSGAIELSAPDAEYGDGFGLAVAVDGDTIVVGAPWRNSPTVGHFTDKPSGAAYVFTRSERGWSLAARLTEPAGDERSWFGSSVSVDGDTIVVGAHSGNHPYRLDIPGAAYVFTKPDDGWAGGLVPAKLTAGDAAGEDFFGLSVSVSGDTVAVGSSSGGYLFTRPVGGWRDTSTGAKFVASDAVGESHSVALRGNIAAVMVPGGLYLFALDRTP